MKISAQEIRALRLLRAALRRGCVVSLYPGEDLSQPYLKDSVTESELADVVLFDHVTVVISEDRVSGATFYLSFGGEAWEAPIRSYSRNTLGEALYREVMGIRDH